MDDSAAQAAAEKKRLRAHRRALQEEQRARKLLHSRSPSAVEVLLIRHGETSWNAEHRLQGQLDPPLNDTGRQQAQQVCAALAERCVCQPVEALYSSDLRRCVETAQPIAAALDLQLCTREALRERHLGVLQGLTKGEAHLMEPAAWSALLNGSDADRVPGGGESVEDLASRAQGAIDDIARKHPGGRVIVVTHGGVLAQLHCLAAGHCSGAPSINCSINSLLVEPGRWALLRWGGVQHLQAGSYAAHAFGGGGRSG
eukprot:jgi/Tetstr1/461628/TSEL_006728.t1